MSLIKNNALVGASGVKGYVLQRSLRFRSSASAYLSRTPASAGNRTTWTWSGWVKRGNLGSYQQLFSAGTSSTDRNYLLLDAGQDGTDVLSYVSGGSTNNFRVYTPAVFRDTASWYHIVLSVDTGQATESNRVKIYINSIQQTLNEGGSGFPSQNHQGQISNTVGHYLGIQGYSTSNAFDGYMTEVNFIDGQALDASSFGEYNADTGVWQPIKYTGTYGTNGFYLNFSDNSTTTTLGYDTSGNGNNWTANNISVTSGATYDSMTDVPTLTSEDAANYATLNPLGADTPSGATLNGNLTLSNSASNQKRATIPVISTDTNKYYWEVTINGTATSNFPMQGMYVVGAGTYWPGYDGNSIGLYQGGSLVYNGSTVATLTSYANGDVISIAFDPSTGKIWFAKNGTWMASGDPATGTSPNYTLPTGVDRVAGGYTGSGYGTLEFNFGQRPFAYTPPTGFKSLNTYNLPDSTIEDGSEYFNATTYTGNGSTQSITGVNFQPDLVWIKSRSTANYHVLVDAVRGVGYFLRSNTTDGDAAVALLSSLDSDGFSIAGGYSAINSSGGTYVSWNWKANGAGVSNTDGSITSTVSANTTAGFSIATFTTPSSFTNATVGHGLSASPAMLIVKRRTTGDWITWHQSLGANGYLTLNTTSASGSNSGSFNGVSSTTWTMGSSAWWQASASDWVCYAFAEVEGFSKMGSYTGNGSTDGPFVYTGFRPAWIMFKRSDSTSDWHLYDTTRSTYNVIAAALYADLANAENSGQPFDILSNGFKLRVAGGELNTSSATIIYMAFAEVPQKFSLAR